MDWIKEFLRRWLFKNDGWISVNDKLPPMTNINDVVEAIVHVSSIMDEDGNFVDLDGVFEGVFMSEPIDEMVISCNPSEYKWYVSIYTVDGLRRCNITHWMPFPKAPKC